MTITTELLTFISFILEGIVGGILLDILRAFRHNRKIKDIVVYLEDFLYWIILGVGVIWLSYILDVGTIRMYMIFGVFLGLIIYFLSLTKVVYKVFDWFCRYFFRLIRWITGIFKGDKNEEKGEFA